YSLGNFATYRGFNLAGPAGLSTVLQIQFGADGTFESGRAVPLMQVAGSGPRPDPARRSAALLRRLSRADFGPTAARIDIDGVISPP
ncbi:MAG: CapA family protein, partial [Gemmatimonadota bacterium]